MDLLRLASAAAACSSWVDLLTGTPNTALCVTSLRMRRWPPLAAIFGDEGGVREPTLWNVRPPACRGGGKGGAQQGRGEEKGGRSADHPGGLGSMRSRKRLLSTEERVNEVPAIIREAQKK